jgi:hypothetical protein
VVTLDRRIKQLEKQLGKEDAEFEAAVQRRLAAVRERCEKAGLFSWLDETLPAEMSRENAAEAGIRWLALADEYESRLELEIADPELRRNEACIRAEMRMGASRVEAESLLTVAEREDTSSGTDT